MQGRMCCLESQLESACGIDNVELGTACGKLHRVSALTITDAGESSSYLGNNA